MLKASPFLFSFYSKCWAAKTLHHQYSFVIVFLLYRPPPLSYLSWCRCYRIKRCNIRVTYLWEQVRYRVHWFLARRSSLTVVVTLYCQKWIVLWKNHFASRYFVILTLIKNNSMKLGSTWTILPHPMRRWWLYVSVNLPVFSELDWLMVK